MQNKKKKKGASHRFRISVLGQLFAIVTVVFAILIADVFLVSVRKVHARTGTNLALYSDTNNTVTDKITARRGFIYDSSGNIIAEDNHTYNIVCYLDPSRMQGEKIAYVKDKEGTAHVLSDILKIDYDKVLGYLSQEGQYQTELGNAGRHLSKDVKDEIVSKELPGIEFEDSIQRVYPLGQFASNLVGYVSMDDDGGYSGKMGMEQILNSYLEGKDGYSTYQTDAQGYILPGMKENTVSATNGANVTLTLNKELQETLEQSFVTTNETFHPDRIWGSVMEVDTGKVVAWGQSPSFDPNTLEISDYSNYGAQIPYEPGSTMKTFTWAATINEGKYDSNARAEGDKYCYVDDQYGNPVRTDDEAHAYGCVTNYHHEKYDRPTLDEGLKYSLNTVAAELENEYITPDILLDYIKKFGFFKNVDTDGLPEEPGHLNFTWAADKMNLSFGQGSTVTMLQLLQAYSAIFSDGKMKKPYFVDSIRDPYDSSKLLYQGETKVTGEPITAETAEKVRSVLYKVVNEPGGTAFRYQIPECSVIGKTGTTEVAINGTYETDYIISSIMLGLPANDPKIMVYYAFEMNFQNIGEKTQAVTNLLRKAAQVYHLSDHMEENKEPAENAPVVPETGVQSADMPALINHSLPYAQDKLAPIGVEPVILGNGPAVIDQFPEADTSVDSGQRVFLLTDTQSFTMPDMTGWTRKDVSSLWAVTGFGFQLEKEGRVVSQSIPPGTVVTKGTQIQVVFG